MTAKLYTKTYTISGSIDQLLVNCVVPCTMLKKGDGGSSSKAKKSASNFDASNGVKQHGSAVSNNARISQSETAVAARKKRDTFSHSIYEKAAEIYRHLKGEIPSSQLPTFDEDLERRRAYSLAFGAKRCEYYANLSFLAFNDSARSSLAAYLNATTGHIAIYRFYSSI